jgi:hypothetical protein
MRDRRGRRRASVVAQDAHRRPRALDQVAASRATRPRARRRRSRRRGRGTRRGARRRGVEQRRAQPRGRGRVPCVGDAQRASALALPWRMRGAAMRTSLPRGVATGARGIVTDRDPVAVNPPNSRGSWRARSRSSATPTRTAWRSAWRRCYASRAATRRRSFVWQTAEAAPSAGVARCASRSGRRRSHAAPGPAVVRRRRRGPRCGSCGAVRAFDARGRRLDLVGVPGTGSSAVRAARPRVSTSRCDDAAFELADVPPLGRAADARGVAARRSTRSRGELVAARRGGRSRTRAGRGSSAPTVRSAPTCGSWRARDPTVPRSGTRCGPAPSAWRRPSA